MLGYRQADVADLSGICREHLSRLEAGLCRPTRRTIRDLANALGVDPGDIFPETSEAPAATPGLRQNTARQGRHGSG
jgi:transcriptional regulator with XRE-family HTH domain